MKFPQFIVLATLGYFGTVHGWLPRASLPCEPDPCENGGSCSRKGISNDYKCTCVGDWDGKNCDVPKQQSQFDKGLAMIASSVDSVLGVCYRNPFGECSTMGTCCGELKGIKMIKLRGKRRAIPCMIECPVEPEECMRGKGDNYMGTVSITESKVECNTWGQYAAIYDEVKEMLISERNGNHNFCRNPDSDSYGPWCFFTKENGDDDVAYCEIPQCEGNGEWTSWSVIVECSTSCGKGYQTRVRTCQGESSDCDGEAIINEECNLGDCVAPTL